MLAILKQRNRREQRLNFSTNPLYILFLLKQNSMQILHSFTPKHVLAYNERSCLSNRWKRQDRSVRNGWRHPLHLHQQPSR